MKWLSRLLARLYPRAWRARYGEEFDALLQDTPPGWSACFDLFKGALRMQVLRMSFSRLAMMLCCTGLVAGWAASYLATPKYISESRLMITVAGDEHRDAAGWFVQLENEVLSRTELWRMIEDPRLDLYPRDRLHIPAEDVVEAMKRRDLRIYPVAHPGLSSHETFAFAVEFRYPDPRKAQAAVQTLLTRFQDANFTRQKRAARARMNAESDQIGELVKRIDALEQKLGIKSAGPMAERHIAGGFNLEVVDPPSLPQLTAYPNRAAFALFGFFAGMALAVVFGVARLLRPRTVALTA